MDDSESGINKSSLMACGNLASAFLPKNIEFEGLNQQPLPCAKPVDMALATYYPSDQLQQMLPFNGDPINSPMLMLMMNHEDFGQFGGLSSSSTIKSTVQYNYDPTAEMIGNMMMFNNPRAHSVSYHGPSRQPVFPYRQGPMVQNVSSQLCIPQFSYFSDANEFEMSRKENLAMKTHY
ncbi:hypothetical protein OIU74_001906 [Salix koriyanagi]|uniref:Uncharacterized protein n=1 Tax=Salix koriyanagi TaxID=2511006 RepID=A0A9Q0X4R6_9ROSI|nr:hypothetical protein OIU74_001906 [Salix koriyanagi]